MLLCVKRTSRPMKSRGTGPIDTRIINQVRLRIFERMEDGIHGELWKYFWMSAPSMMQTRVKMRVKGFE